MELWSIQSETIALQKRASSLACFIASGISHLEFRNLQMRSVLTASVSVVLLMTPVLMAKSDDVPVLNVQQVCRGIAQQAMDPSETGGPDLAMSQCVASEQEVRSELVKAWPAFVSADKQHCTREATMGGEASYTELITCLEMARDVRRMRVPNDHTLDNIQR